MNPTRLRSGVVIASLVLCACSSPQVRTLGTGGGAPAFELHGQNMAMLDNEARRLCSQGYMVLRQSQNFSPPAQGDSEAAQWLQDAGDWVSGMPGNQAQATVQCRL